MILFFIHSKGKNYMLAIWPKQLAAESPPVLRVKHWF